MSSRFPYDANEGDARPRAKDMLAAPWIEDEKIGHSWRYLGLFENGGYLEMAILIRENVTFRGTVFSDKHVLLQLQHIYHRRVGFPEGRVSHIEIRIHWTSRPNEFTNKKITPANKYEKCGYYRLHIAEYRYIQVIVNVYTLYKMLCVYII